MSASRRVIFVRKSAEGEPRVPKGQPGGGQWTKIGQGNSGDVFHDGEHVYKTPGPAELQAHADLAHSEHVAAGSEHEGMLKREHFPNILSIDTVPREKRDKFGAMIARNFDNIVGAICHLTAAGYYYGDPLQFGVKGGKLKLLDFSMARRNGFARDNYGLLHAFLTTFHAEHEAKMAGGLSSAVFLLTASSREFSYQPGARHPASQRDNENIEAIRKGIGDADGQCVYYTRNARTIPAKHGPLAMLPERHGLFPVVTTQPLPDAFLKEWELHPFYLGDGADKQDNMRKSTRFIFMRKADTATAVIDGITREGHWRTIHGHRVFIAENGQFFHFQKDGYKWKLTEWKTGEAKLDALVKQKPTSAIRLKPGAHSLNREAFEFHGKVEELERNVKANPPSSIHDRKALSAIEKLKQGKGLESWEIAGLARYMPHGALDKAAGEIMTNPYRQSDYPDVSARQARIKMDKLDAIKNLGEKAVARAQALKAKAAASSRAATAKRQVAARKEAAVKTKALPAFGSLLDAVAGAKDAKTKRVAVVKLASAMIHAGLLREATRGATKGQLVVDTTLGRSLLTDPKRTDDTTRAAVAAMAASAGMQEHFTGQKFLGYSEYAKKYWTKDPDEYRNAEFAEERVKANERRVNKTPHPREQAAAYNKREAFKTQNYEIATTIAKALEEHAAGNFPELQALLTGQVSAAKVATGNKAALETVSLENQQGARDRALAAQKNEKWTPPKKLTMSGFGRGAKLHGYQVQGVNWGLEVKRGLNGFDTGLGKTLTSLALALKWNESGATDQGHIIVPVTKVLDFVEEAKKAAPRAVVVAVHGNPEERAAALKKAPGAEIVVFGSSAINQPECVAYIKGRKKASLQVDEVHKFKRRGEGMTKKLEALMKGREHVIGYTATPTPNYDDDYFNIVDMLRPGSIGTKAQALGRKLVDQILDAAATGGKVDLSSTQRLHERGKPWVFIKKRTDPDVKIHVPAHLALEDWQERPDEFDHYDFWASEYAGEKNETLLGMIGELQTLQRQIAISPALVYDKYAEHMGLGKKSVKDYKGPEPKIDQCVDQCLDHIGDATKKGQPFVVTCDFNGGLDRVRHRLEQMGVPSTDIMEYSGRTNTKDRATKEQTRDLAKKRANNGEISVLLLNTAAGGVGLNLQGNKAKGTGPSAMFILNEPWRDMDTTQVIDRVSRQGQQRETTSWISRMRDTIDDKVHNLVAGKGVVGSVLKQGTEGVQEDLERRFERMTYQDRLKYLNMPEGFKERMEKKYAELDKKRKAAKATATRRTARK